MPRPGRRPSSPDVLTAGRVAELLRCAPDTARRMIDSDEIPGYRVGRDRRVARSVMRAYLAARPGLKDALDELDRIDSRDSDQ